MAAVFVLFVVVFIHELGHFLVARWCGVDVSAFSIGFGREIAGFTDKHGTRWKLGWIPLGGYVKFMDDENGASVPSRDKVQNMSEAQRKGAFQLKPLWARVAVVSAGPMANFLSAIIMFAAVAYTVGTIVVPALIKVKPLNPAIVGGMKSGDQIAKVDGQPVADFKAVLAEIEKAPGREIALDIVRNGAPITVKVTPEPQVVSDGKGGTRTVGALGIDAGPDKAKSPVEVTVRPNYAAVLAGLKTDDLVKRVDGEVIADFQQLSTIIAKSAGKELTFDLVRTGAEVAVKVKPETQRVPDGFGGFETRGIVGIEPGADRTKLPVNYPSVAGALVAGVEQTWLVVTSTLSYVADVIRGKQAADKIGGLPTIIDVSNQMAKYGVAPLIQLIGLISVSIGLINLFPIPLLDGGHLMYYAAEAVRGRPLSDQTQEFGFRIGLTIVMMLMVFALWNDRLRILKWFS
jgi:regulator of sigma E protease